MQYLSERLATVGLLLCTLLLGLYGIGRSLWLDEAWVANSIHSPSLAGMFEYPEWLQTSPPLFLLLARSAVLLFGFSTVTLRLVPMALALVAVAAILAAARRVGSPSFAALACAVLAFHPTTVEYFRSFKQYSGEVAATGLVLLATVRYLQSPKRREYFWLLGAVMVAMPLSYPTVFLLPGVLWVIRDDLRRSTLLAASSAAMLAILYWWFIRPNVSPALNVYWSVGGRDWRIPLLTGLLAIGAVVWSKRLGSGNRGCVVLLCSLPFVLFSIAGAAGWYPQSPRTSLFLRPCLVLIMVVAAEEIFTRMLTSERRLWVDSGAILLTVLVVILGMRKQFHEGRFQPEEDFAGVVRYLSKNVKASDIVLVHPSAREGFMLYTSMQGWYPSNVVFADTGWPCCPRGKDAPPRSSTEQGVIADLDAKIPRDFAGRIWLFQTGRPTHWNYIGLDEGEAWRRYFWSRSCLPGPYIMFPNLGISPVICGKDPP